MNDTATGYYPNASQISEVRAASRRMGHGVDTTDVMLKRSKDSAWMLPYWDMNDCLIDGVEALRAEGRNMLPDFHGETNDEYTNRLKFTKYTNVYGDIIEGLASKPFQEEVKFSEDGDKAVPDTLLELMENIDGSGNNLSVFAYDTFYNAIGGAIDWILVDAPAADPNVKTRADAKAAGIRPYWSHVLGRNMIDIQSKMMGGNEVIVYARIFEPGEVDHVRVFERLDSGTVTWTLYRRTEQSHPVDATQYTDKGETRYVVDSEGTISIGTIPLSPFWTGKRDGRSWRFFAPMRAAADLAKDLYQQESALKWSKTLAGYPMLAGNGIMPRYAADSKTVLPVSVGPGRVLYSPPDGQGNSGHWEYIQPDADILKFLAEDIDSTIKQLREVGRQPLTAQSNLTVINSAAAAGKAKSSVKAWAHGLRDALENATVFTLMFLGINTDSYDASVYVYTEFDEWAEGKDLDTLDKDRDRGDISRETLLEEKQRRGVYGPEFTIAREEQRLQKEIPNENAPDRYNSNIVEPPLDPAKPNPPAPNTPPKKDA